MLRVATLNLNGIRSALRKGFREWMAQHKPDVLCVQETRAWIERESALYDVLGYKSSFVNALKKGYSGVGIYSKHQPMAMCDTLGWKTADEEGRYIHWEFKDFVVVSVYFPSGTSGELRQAIKFQFMEYFYKHILELKRRGKPFIICGDWNIAHKEIDLKNWRSNQKNSGFLPEERNWLTQVFDELQLVDGFRVINQETDQYTWWSNRGRAREKNVGWRIDYQIVSPDLVHTIKSVSIYKDTVLSDHAPLIIEYDLNINL